MTHVIGPTSRARLAGVHPRLVAVVERAYQLSPFDLVVVEGLRSKARQAQLYAQGRTVPGPKVTWTLDSKHNPQADGFGHAVDLAPWIGGKIDWTPGAHFDGIAKAMFDAGDELGVPIRWGADWDRDGIPRERGETDSPHFELPTGWRP